MADTPTEAAAPAPAGETVATPNTNTNTEPAKVESNSVDLHGFTQEDLAGMRTFIDNNGGWDKIKSRISNPQPQPVENTVENSQTQQSAPTSQPQTQPVEQTQTQQPKTPEGAITQAEFLAQQYFKALAGEEKYAPIAKEIASGDLLKEMASFNIRPLNQDGSINDTMVRRYLDLKAQTVPARPTSTEPNMSNAPTVDYIAVGDKIDSMEQAQAVFMQPGHPAHQMAADYIKAVLAGKDPNAAVDKK